MGIKELTKRDIIALEVQLLEEGRVLVAMLPVCYVWAGRPLYHKFGGVSRTVEGLLQIFTNRYNTYDGGRTFHIGWPLCVFSRLQDCPDLPTMWARILLAKESSILRWSKDV